MAIEPKLGDKVRDSITGFAGIVTAITEYLNGCKRVSVQPQNLKDGVPIDVQYFDVEQVEVLETKTSPVLSRTGGPMPAPQNRQVPKA